MGMMIVRHKVGDYSKWRRAFDADAPHQKAAGLSNPRVMHSADDNRQRIVPGALDAAVDLLDATVRKLDAEGLRDS